VKERGFDDSAYTKIALATFTQVHKLFLELMNVVSDENLKQQIANVIPDVGRIQGKSKLGDRRETTLNPSIPVVQKIRALYPAFNRVSRQDQAFDIVVNIQGLIEFYAEYAEAEVKGQD
jgi:hypothetical protein